MTKQTASTCHGARPWCGGMAGSSIYTAACGRAVLGLGRPPTSSDAPNGYSQQGSAKTDLWGLLWKLRASLGSGGAGGKGRLPEQVLPALNQGKRRGGWFAGGSQVPDSQHGEWGSRGPSVHPWTGPHMGQGPRLLCLAVLSPSSHSHTQCHLPPECLRGMWFLIEMPHPTGTPCLPRCNVTDQPLVS